MKTLIINYGMGNLGSVRRALEECGADVTVSEDPADLRAAERIILPGVGAFGDGMANLIAGGWPAEINRALENPQVALLGLCLGMQLLAEHGDEGGERAGLGLVPGHVRRLEPSTPEIRIPHVGWNELHFLKATPLFHGLHDCTDFYFVHSYHFVTGDPMAAYATTPYCGGFTSVVGTRNVFGTQFHPEKSSRPGFHLLRNFLSYSLIDA